MRCRYFACVSFSLAAFLCNHAHARIGETYEESVKRYTAAGFTEERTTEEIPPDDPELKYFSFDSNHAYNDYYRLTGIYLLKRPHSENLRGIKYIAGLKYQGLKEVTWTKKEPKEGTAIEVVSVRQLFYGEWPPTNRPGPWEPILRCFDIRYEFREPLKKSTTGRYKGFLLTEEFREWIGLLFPTNSDFLGNRKLQVRIIKTGNDWLRVVTGNNYSSPKDTSGETSADGKSLRIKLGENQWFFKLPKPSLEAVIAYELQLHTEREAKEVKPRQKKEVHKKPPPPPLPPPPNIKKEFEESGL